MYNHYCELIPDDDDWVCMMDHDIMFLNPKTAIQIKDITQKYPETGLFTCVTNRVGNKLQCYNHTIEENPDILYHKEIADNLIENHYDKVLDIQRPISGLLMVFRKSTWKLLGGFKPGLLTVDNDFSKKVLQRGLKIKLMKGVYVFHYYRLKEGRKHIQHLLK
jgi:GT2 family glycosyltransferase